MKVAVGSLAIGDVYRELMTPCIQTHKMYCEKHGYPYIMDESVYDGVRPFPWYKIQLIKKYISSYDYFVWLDADTIVWNDSVKLDELVKCMGDASILCAHDLNNINSGVMIIKNTPYIMGIIDAIWDNTVFINHQWWEQASLIDIYQRNEACRKHIAIIPQEHCYRFNAYCNNLEPTSWILHFAGMRGELLSSAIEQYSASVKPQSLSVTYDFNILLSCDLPALPPP
jgi:hypothetical protein